MKESSSGALPSDSLSHRDTPSSIASPTLDLGPHPRRLSCRALADPLGHAPSVRDKTGQKYFSWNSKHHAKVRECFMKLASKRYKDLMFALRGAKEKPPWILDDVYTCIWEYWKSDKFVAISEAAKNRNEGLVGEAPGNHTVGS
ncbi:hypothetical protein M9H77_19306 [Catharanthus roseus]|uniref:Uncharacterized protein n=1 Tax=Catharanthus roseus TaxID=4058 RepID=A0ACC0BA07_CATRO|nr:hypothetical protein M9H77_19306 [Catharanthus roseus]